MKVALLLPSLVLLFVFAGLANLRAETREEERVRLNAEFSRETDRSKQDAINRRLSELHLEQANEDLANLRARLATETDSARRRELNNDLADAAISADRPEIVLEVATGGRFAEFEIAIPERAERHTVTPRYTLKSTEPHDADRFPCVIRRVTADRLEVWQPKRGWLFDGQGRLLNEARPPRRDGVGREWHGAFLPDGRWVTTDLWELDCTLTFFSRAGRWLKEIHSRDLVPPDGEFDTVPALLGWCRSDREGKGWVVSVGANEGRGVAWVGPRGSPRVLVDPLDPWRLCFPRDLEPKGMYTSLSVPNDRCDVTLTRSEASHGMRVGFPTFNNERFSIIIPDGNTFGFWPKSNDIYIVTETWHHAEASVDAPEQKAPHVRTLFYRADGTFAGWINAERLADATARGAMLFHAGKGRIVSLGNDLRVRSVQHLRWPDGTDAVPTRLFPDLHIGFFEKHQHLILARWR